MRHTLISLLLLALLSACTSSQEITSTWVNREALPKGPYKSIFVLALVQNINAKIDVENEMARLLASRGRKVVKSSDIFTPRFLSENKLSKEKMAQIIKDSGCDAVYTIALLDVKSEDRYQPGTAYYPISHGYNGNYYGYFGNYYLQVNEPGYYVTDKTYYIETNFYDLATDQLLWSIQSDACNPSSIQSWFHGYSRLMIFELRKEGLIKK